MSQILRIAICLALFFCTTLTACKKESTDPNSQSKALEKDAFELVGNDFDFYKYEIISPEESGLVGVWQFVRDAYYNTNRGFRFEFFNSGELIQWLRNPKDTGSFIKGPTTSFVCTTVGMKNESYGFCVYKIVGENLYVFWLKNNSTVPEVQYWEVYQKK